MANLTEVAKNHMVFAMTKQDKRKQTCTQNTSCAHINTVSHGRRDVGHVLPKAALEGLMRSFVLGADSLVKFHLAVPMRRAKKHGDSERGKRSMKVICCPKIPYPL